MKTIFRSVWALVVAASAFVACSDDDLQTTSEPRYVEMTVVTSSEVDSSAPQSRTGFNPATGAVYWNQSGEFLEVFETAGTKTTPKDSAEGVVTDNGTKASFGVSFPENTAATAFTYNAIYPASAWVSGNDNTDVAKLKVITPNTQSPAETSFDPAADLLIALPVTRGIQPTELDMRFKRMVAIGKMTIKSLASTDPITSIVFTAPGKKVTGRSYLNLSEGTAVEYGYQGQSNDNLTLTFASDRNFTTGNQTYFTCFPFELTAGETFSVTIKAGNKTFTKEVTLGEGRSLAFAAGASSTFTVNMSGIEGVETKTLDGDYVIVAKQNDVYYAMSSEAEKTRLAAKTIEYDGISEKFATTDATIIWKIAKDGDNYTITNAEKYLSWQGGSTNGATTSDSSYALSITPNDDGTYKIGSVDNTQRILAKNNDPTLGFAFYTTGSQTKDLLLIKVGEDTRIQLAAPLNLMADATGNIVEVVWDAVEGAENYTVTCGDQSQTVTTTDAEFTMQYGKTYTVNVVANPTDTENYKSSEAATVEVTTGENPNPTIASIKDMIAWAEGQNEALKTSSNTSVSVANYADGYVEGYVAAAGANLNKMLAVVDNTGEPGTGIIVYGDANYTEANYPVGSKVKIDLSKATIKNYNQLYELMDATVSVVANETAQIVVPEITLETFNSNAYMGMYVKIKDVATQESGVWNSGTSTVNKILKDAAGNTLTVRIQGTATFKGDAYVAKTGDILGVAQKYNTTVQLFPNSSSDVAAFADTAPRFVSFDPSVSFKFEGETKTVNFTTANLGNNQVFAKIEGEGAGQFTAGTVGEGSVEITAAENTETVAKSATLTLYIAATENGEPLASVKITLSQAAKSTGEGPSVGTILWSEDWTGGAANDVPSKYAQTGTTVYNGNTVIYAESSTSTKLYNEKLAGGTAPELLLSKNKQTWTITGIPINGVSKAMLTMKANYASRTQITYYLDDATTGTTINGITATINNTSGAKNLKIVITNTSGSNVRLDDIELKVAE